MRAQVLRAAAWLTVLGLAGTGAAAIDPILKQTDLNGISLYWVPLKQIEPDTVNWDALASVMPKEERSGVRTVGEAAALLEPRGWKLLRVKKCSGMGLGLLLEKGYRVCVLSQWHASLRNDVVVPRPGMAQNSMKHNLVSHFHWELASGASIGRAQGKGSTEFSVRVDFRNHGHSVWDGHDNAEGNNRQILGTAGTAVSLPELSFHEDLTVKRQLYRMYVIVESDKKAKQIVRDVESGMDALKLDLSYIVPTFHAVEPTEAPRRTSEQEKVADTPSDSASGAAADSTAADRAVVDTAMAPAAAVDSTDADTTSAVSETDGDGEAE